MNEKNIEIDGKEKAYLLGKKIGEKDAIRFMVKSFMSSAPEEYLIDVYEYFERQYYKKKQ